MDETTEMLRAVLGRLEELNAKMTGIEKTLSDFRSEVNERLEDIEQRLDYYGDKWQEHDQEIWRLKRKQA